MQEYEVRKDLKQSLQGPYFQVLVALSYIFDALKHKKQLNIMLERAGVGALDDIVIEYFDEKRTKKERTLFLQLKHAANDSEVLTEGDFKNKSGKLEIFKYFDDWYLFIKNNQHTPYHCIYYTNRDFCNTLKNRKLFEAKLEGHRFSSKFLKKQLYKDMLAMVKRNSVLGKRALADEATSNKLNKNPTYKKAKEYYDNGGKDLTEADFKKEFETFLKDHYLMMVGKQHADQLEQEVVKLVAEYFPEQEDSEAIFNALIMETWSWFRAIKNVGIWTEATVREKLVEFQARFNELPQEIGRTASELSQSLKKLSSKIVRESLLAQLDKVMMGQDKLVVFEGGKDYGKSTLIAEYLINKTSIKPGHYLYFASPLIFFEKYKNLLVSKNLAIFIVDGVEEDSEQLQEAMEVCQANSKRLILFSRVPIPKVTSSPFPNLSSAEIKDYLEQEDKLGYCITIGSKHLRLKDIVKHGNSGLFTSMQLPSNLQALCKLAQPESQSCYGNDPVNPYMVNSQANFEPIPLFADKILPLYTLEKALGLSDFKGSKCIQCDDIQAIEKFKRQLAQADKFIWLDVSTIDYANNADADIIELLVKQIGEGFKLGDFYLLLTDNNNELITFPKLLQTLVEHSQIVIFTEQTITAKHIFSLISQGRSYYLEYKSDTLKYLPYGSSSKKQSTKSPLQEALKSDYLQKGTAIVADAGAGKSTTLKQLYNDFSRTESLVWGEHYQHFVLVPFSRLPTLQLTSLLDVCNHFLNIKDELLSQALETDLNNGRVLFLLDAWDELSGLERQKLQPLLSQFADYQRVIITTRPGDRTQLFFNPAGMYELQRFSLEQVEQCFRAFFKNDDEPEVAAQFTQQAAEFLKRPENVKALEVIGLPLQCYLLCEAWRPAFEAVCQGQKIKMPWERTAALSRAELYQLFVISRLRKCLVEQQVIVREGTLQTAEQICILGNSYLIALQRAAYEQLIRGKPLQLADDWFSKQIARLGLVDGSEFVHKTYAEYFLALYAVNLLIKDTYKAREFIAQYRYQSHYQLVFEFMAAIVSYGDPIIPAATSYLRDFWDALLQSPRDRIGYADNALIKGCYTHSNEQALEAIFEIQTLLSIRKSITEQIADVDTTETYKTDLAFSQNSNPASDMELVFEEPEYDSDWLKYAANIAKLPVAKYNAEDKQKALNWLLNKITHWSYRIREACADKFGDIGMATPEVKAALLKQFVNADERSKEYECAINALVKLDYHLAQTELDGMLEKIKTYLTNKRLPHSVVSWLGRQNYSFPQLYRLLEDLKCAAFETQYALVSELASSHKQSFLDEIQKLHPDKNKWGSLYYCFQHALLLGGKIDVCNYFASICSIDYLEENAFHIISGLIEPTRSILQLYPVAEIDRKRWQDKIYGFALQTVNAHEEKNKISKLIIELVNLKLDANNMKDLLIKFLSSAQDRGFWDADAVMPCLPHLLPYFEHDGCRRILSGYIFYKATGTEDYIRWPLCSLLDFEVDKLLTEAGKQRMVETCLAIYDHYAANRSKFSKALGISINNPVYYVINFQPRLVLPALLEDLAESRCAFLQTYLHCNQYALTIYDDKIQIHTSSDIQEFPTTVTQSKRLSVIISGQNLFCPEGLNKLEPPRSPSPEVFSFSYPGIFSNRKRPRSNSLEVKMAAEEPSSKIAKREP